MYNWGIIGTGWIAHEMGEALKRMDHGIYVLNRKLYPSDDCKLYYPI